MIHGERVYGTRMLHTLWLSKLRAHACLPTTGDPPPRGTSRRHGGGAELEPEWLRLTPGKSQVEKYRREERRHRDIIDGIRLKIEAKTKRLTDAFRKFDENSDGVVSYSEFRAGLFNLGAID